MTELDQIVLAIVARDGPMSAYDVRKVFAGSLTPGWSSSAGSIYPSIRRLESEGLVSIAAPQGARETRKVSINTAGATALGAWLTSDSADIAAATPDPIRTRCYFLSLMEEGERQAFLVSALHHTEAALSAAQNSRGQRQAAGEDPLFHLVSEGVVFQLRARRNWLQSMIDKMPPASD